MAEALSKTLTHGDFDSVFQEVPQPETVGWTTEGELRLFHLESIYIHKYGRLRIFQSKA